MHFFPLIKQSAVNRVIVPLCRFSVNTSKSFSLYLLLVNLIMVYLGVFFSVSFLLGDWWAFWISKLKDISKSGNIFHCFVKYVFCRIVFSFFYWDSNYAYIRVFSIALQVTEDLFFPVSLTHSLWGVFVLKSLRLSSATSNLIRQFSELFITVLSGRIIFVYFFALRFLSVLSLSPHLSFCH